MSVVVADTSPIRALDHLGRLDLLSALFQDVLIPPAVAKELAQPRSRFAAVRLADYPFLRVRAPRQRALVIRLLGVLEPGEAEALALAEECRAAAVLIDESAGRRVAVEMGLAPLGVMGILLRARRAGLVEAVTPLLDRLQHELGFFISAALRARVLEEAGE